MRLDHDFSELLASLRAATDVRFLVAGGYAVAAHGHPPLRVDLLTALDGVAFDDCWAERVKIDIDGIGVPFIGRADLLRNKRASGRPQDLADLDAVEGGE